MFVTKLYAQVTYQFAGMSQSNDNLSYNYQI